MSQKTVKTKPFTVISNGEEVLVTGNYNDALSKMDELMVDNVPVILLKDDKRQRTLQYSKGRYDKNYKITSIPYVHPVESAESAVENTEN
jgi:hypothetical protein